MKIIDLKCPNCGGKLKRVDNEFLHCPSCNSDFIIDDETPDYYTINNNYGSKNTNENKPTLNSKNINHKLVTRFLLLFAVILAPMIAMIVSSLSSNQSEIAPSTKKYIARKKPQSEAAKLLVEEIFHKPFDSITTKELNKIKYLKVLPKESNKPWSFYYSLTEWTHKKNDYPLKEITLHKKADLDLLDFTCFKGLNYLDFNDNLDFKRGSESFSLANLNELVYYGNYFNQPLNQIIEALPNPDNLRYLKTQIRSEEDIQLLKSQKNLDGLIVSVISEKLAADNFKQLTQLNELELNSSFEGDVNWLSSLTNLKSLTLTSANDISDYSFLYGMSNLEQLHLSNATNLKEISFVENMPKLKKLTLNGTAFQSLAPLKDKASLIELNLDNNNLLADLSSLDSLVNLTNLSISTSDSQKDIKIPSLSKLPFLSTATLESKLLPLIEGSQTIKDLTFISWFSFDYSQLTTISNLEKISISASTMGPMQKKVDLRPLTHLKSITLLEGQYESGGDFSNDFFNLPQLEELIITKEATIKIHLGSPFDMTNLKRLEIYTPLSSISFYDKDGHYINNNNGLAPLIEKIEGFTNLEELHLPSAQLQDLNFTKNLTQLKYLNVSDNYITDIAPLLNSKHLAELKIDNNPVKNLDLLPESVYLNK